jgi:uncharacterized protein YndB with AHSA1/START domain
MTEETIHLRRMLNAPQDRVFQLWTEPEYVRRWFGGLDTEVQEILMDLRPGGEYSIQVETEQGPSTISGRFLEVEAPDRLVYTWQLDNVQGSLPVTKVEVEFRPRGDQTEVELRHGPFTQPEAKVLHADGWQACFEGLEQLT